MVQTTLRDYLQDTEDALGSNRVDEAMENCRYILTHFPEALEAQRLLGEVYLAQGQFEDAQQTFDWILANDPENVIAYCDRALISEQLSDIDTALDCYQQAYELSRGNSQIRQQFNQLSARVGQQDFMFSRAGLARIYMRGDLLTQAIQEWEAVLSATPDRLDARTGLLETYWRDGLNEQVEQLARQILEEIPSCLKALLLLAHVTSAYNMQQAQELIKRAEALDPELIMAQELFSDLQASQPDDPFLAFLKKEPIILLDAADSTQDGGTVPEELLDATLSPAVASDSLFDWESLESWSEVDTLVAPPNNLQPVEEGIASSTWFEENSQQVESWSNQIHSGRPVEGQLHTSQEIEEEVESVSDQQPWYQDEQQGMSSSESINSWDNNGSPSPVNSANTWETTANETRRPSPPAWLDMLTKGEELPSITELFSQSSIQSEEEPKVGPIAAHLEQEASFTAATPNAQQEQEQPFTFASEESDADLGWPEWLKSLGAATFDNDTEPAVEQDSLPVQETPFESWTDVGPWSEQVDKLLPDKEEQAINTLENLESDLYAQGFVPLEPGSLSTIAQEPSLSSALAQLGNFASTPSIQEDAPQEEQVAPDYDSILRSNEQASPAPTRQFSYPEKDAQPIAENKPASKTQPLQESLSAAHAEYVPETTLEAVHIPDTEVGEVTPLSPSYHAETSFEDELETTMKRPVFKLPQTHTSAQFEQQGRGNKSRSGDRIAADKVTDGTGSYKDRLLRGYHHQLAGDYDEAMQEYRLIIRGDPELLSEVISNVRALLKLAPKYAAGYRVLGDAYMRQGEYLQAMEAYNKALTMAKKAKGHGS